MTDSAPLTGRDTAAAYKGLIIGFICVALVVVTIVTLTNRKFANEEPAAAETH